MSSTHPFPSAASPSLRPPLDAILGRAVVVGVVGAAISLLVDRLAPTEDANIGAGLVALASVLVITTGWGFVDGRDERGAGPYVLWLAVSVVATVGTAVVASLAATVFAPGTGTADVIGMLFMGLVTAIGAIPFVLGPAALGVLVGQLTARRRD